MEQIRKMTYNYNHSIHETTNEMPWEIMTKKISTMRLPSAIAYFRSIGDLNRQDDESNDQMVVRDYQKKTLGKDYSNDKNKSAESGIKIGDFVVCKEMETKTKLKSNFRPKLFEVISRVGNEIHIKSDDGEICRRNVSAVKAFRQADFEKMMEAESDERKLPTRTADTCINDTPAITSSDTPTQVPLDETQDRASTNDAPITTPTSDLAVNSRPQRQVKKPKRYIQVVTHDETFFINKISLELFRSTEADIKEINDDEEINIEFLT
jgi:hypothetical protein